MQRASLERYNSAGRTTRKVDVAYTADVEFERGDTDQQIVFVADQEGDRRGASKRAPKARLVLVEAKPWCSAGLLRSARALSSTS